MSEIPSHTELLRQLMDKMSDNIFFKDQDSKFILMNKACAKWNGFSSPEAAIGKCDFDIFKEDFARSAREDEKHIFSKGESVRCKEEKAEWPDGHVQWVSTTKIPLFDPEGNVVGCIGIGRDITELKRKEEELRLKSMELRKAYAELKEANDRIEQDLRMAARLQNTFLPSHYPKFSGEGGDERIAFQHYYEAATAVGGDYCAVWKLNDHMAGLLICDVMGHGVCAALVTGLIRAITSNIFHKAKSAGEFMSELNRRLYPMLRENDRFLFVTACYLTVDLDSMELTGAQAGHAYPFKFSHELGRVGQLNVPAEAVGPGLTITEDHRYKTFKDVLSPGDEIYLFTDGMTEACNPAGEEFGIEGLLCALGRGQSVPFSQRIQLAVDEVKKFTSCKHLDDDICMLGFKLIP